MQNADTGIEISKAEMVTRCLGIVITNDKSACSFFHCLSYDVHSIWTFPYPWFSPVIVNQHYILACTSSTIRTCSCNIIFQGCLPLWQSMTKYHRSNHLLYSRSILLGAWYYASLFVFVGLNITSDNCQTEMSKIKVAWPVSKHWAISYHQRIPYSCPPHYWELRWAVALRVYE